VSPRRATGWGSLRSPQASGQCRENLPPPWPLAPSPRGSPSRRWPPAAPSAPQPSPASVFSSLLLNAIRSGISMPFVRYGGANFSATGGMAGPTAGGRVTRRRRARLDQEGVPRKYLGGAAEQDP